MWSDSALVLATAGLLAAAATPLARRLAVRLEIIDRPAARKDHLRPVPLLGGLALYLAVIGSLLLYPERRAISGVAGILLGGTWVSFLGVWDDRNGLRVSNKLAAQVLAASVLILFGVRVQLVLPEGLNLLLTFLWVLGITNAFNLLDNMDGLCGGVGGVAAAFFLLLALLNGQYLVAPLAAALVGACGGFLIYNFNPARIFLGDSGSLFLGFLLAVVGIKLRFPDNVSSVTWLVPVLVLGVAIFDTTLVVFSRLRRGLNPFLTPGRDHLSHRLVRCGLSRRQAVLVIYALGLSCGGLALLVSVSGPLLVGFVVAGLLVLTVVAIWWLDRPGLLPRDETARVA